MMMKRFFLKYLSRSYSSDLTSLCGVNSTLDQLVLEYGNKHLFKKLFLKEFQLKNTNLQQWNKYMSVLKKHDFNSRDCINILIRNPDVFNMTDDQIDSVVGAWKNSSRLPRKQVASLLVSRPEFFLVKVKELNKRMPFLLSYTHTEQYLKLQLLMCPNLLFENWEEVQKKINFLNDEMIVHRTEVLGCRALTKSYNELKLRFSILNKCGLYKKPNPHDHKQEKRERFQLNNPPLHKITDIRDKLFAKDVLKISYEEYEVFAEMFKAESEDTLHSMDNSDIDSDSDEE